MEADFKICIQRAKSNQYNPEKELENVYYQIS